MIDMQTSSAATRPLKAARLRALPAFLFNEIDNLKRAAIASGKDVINLGVGDPDQPTPGFIIDAMDKAMRIPANHQYPDCWGTKQLLTSAANYMGTRFGVSVDPHKNILVTIGGKDGIAHLPLALLDPGDGAIVFTPAYPVYASATILAGGVVHAIPASADSGWLPDFHSSPTLEALNHAGPRSRVLWMNYPGNPSGATASPALYRDALNFAQRHHLTVASDLAYSELYLNNDPACIPSIWQPDIGADIRTTRAIEFHSLSKTFNMTGWRVGFAVGHEDVINALRQVKDNVDSGVFNAIQSAAAAALDRFNDPEINAIRTRYAERSAIVCDALSRITTVTPPRAGIFVWARCPIDSQTGRPMNSWTFSKKLIEEAAVVTVPGAGFGETSADWFRVGLTRETGRLKEAMERIGGLRY
jgi:LL-diaminopimelate aminotransferase